MCMLLSARHDVGRKELFTTRPVDAELVEELRENATAEIYNQLGRARADLVVISCANGKH